MKNNSLFAVRCSLFAVLVNLCISQTAFAQSISSAWNSAPSNCDTGCAQSGLVSVAGSNSGSDGNWRLVYNGSLTAGSVSIPSTAKMLYVQGKCGNTNVGSWMFPSSYSGVFAD